MKKPGVLAIVFLVFITFVMFFKIFTKGLYPIPGDLLVSFYYPFYAGGWEGYDPWTTRKELLAADTVRQIYPWREFAIGQYKDGKFPLWNQYSFSGQPLASNFQSGAYYPLNIIFFIADFKNAWILLVILQAFLGGLFMYMAIRSFYLSKPAACFSALAFMFSSYVVAWLENGNIIHSYIWMPFGIWAINNYFHKFQLRYILTLIFALSFSILAGHPQTVIYVYLSTILFWVFKSIQHSKNYFKMLTFLTISILTPIAVSAVQIIPTIDFYRYSPISASFSKEVFDKFLLPLQNLVAFFAADFFGHPASNNFWSKNYGDFTPYFGVIPLVFALWGAYIFWKNAFAKFAAAVSLFFIIAALPGPITWIIKTLGIPILDSTSPARFISISIFFLIILSAMGLEEVVSNLKSDKKTQHFIKFITLLSLFYIFLWLFAIFAESILQPKEVWEANLAVTRRNLILPTGMFLFIPISLIFIKLIGKFFKIKDSLIKKIFLISVFAVTIFGAVFYSNKFLPTSPKKFIYPDHALFNWLKANAGINRFFGIDTASIDYNLPIHYMVYGAEGYDSLRLERYAELIASSYKGEIPSSYHRSDATFPPQENGYRKRLFDLLGVKYLLDKIDDPVSSADWKLHRFNGDNVKGLWQYEKFQIYERQDVLPRYFMTTNFTVIENGDQIIQKIYDTDFDLKTIILEKDPGITILGKKQIIEIPELKKYDSNEVIFHTSSESNSLLFLSDAWDKGWRATIDSSPAEIFRAHYALRAVAVPSGKHEVVFKYQPSSHTLGLYISLASLFLIGSLVTISIKSKKF